MLFLNTIWGFTGCVGLGFQEQGSRFFVVILLSSIIIVIINSIIVTISLQASSQRHRDSNLVSGRRHHHHHPTPTHPPPQRSTEEFWAKVPDAPLILAQESLEKTSPETQNRKKLGRSRPPSPSASPPPRWTALASCPDRDGSGACKVVRRPSLLSHVDINSLAWHSSHQYHSHAVSPPEPLGVHQLLASALKGHSEGRSPAHRR